LTNAIGHLNNYPTMLYETELYNWPILCCIIPSFTMPSWVSFWSARAEQIRKPYSVWKSFGHPETSGWTITNFHSVLFYSGIWDEQICTSIFRASC